MTGQPDIDGTVRFRIANGSGQPLHIWCEPFCNETVVPTDRQIAFRAALLGDPSRQPSPLAAAFGTIADKVRGGPRGPELELGLDRTKDGTLRLTLWLDETDEVGFLDRETGAPDLTSTPVAPRSGLQPIAAALGLGQIGRTLTETGDSMTRRHISTGSPFEETFAYSRAVVQGDWCFCAGTTGYDYDRMVMPEDPAEQARNTFETIKRALTEAGFAMADIVRVQVTVTDPAHWEASAEVVRHYLGDIRPANTTVVSQLYSPEMKIEIEATAYRGR